MLSPKVSEKESEKLMDTVHGENQSLLSWERGRLVRIEREARQIIA